MLVDADLWVMSDDVYEHIVYDGLAPHLFHIEPRLKSHGIVFNSLSKTYAMTGWRIGFAAGPKEAIAAAGRLQSQNSGNPNSITQAAAIEALTGPQDELKPMLEAFRERNALVVERVRRIPGFKLPNIPQGAFYAFPNVSDLLGTPLWRQANHRRRHARGVFCSTKRTSRWSAATTSARPITSGSPTPLRRRI